MMLCEIGCDVDVVLLVFVFDWIWCLWFVYWYLLLGGGLFVYYCDLVCCVLLKFEVIYEVEGLFVL